jgi:transcriptional regulator with GAF, ATPase, and Fis domain
MDPAILHAISLAATQERSVEAVLRRIVEGIGQQSGVALVRIWLLGPGDRCEVCRRQGASGDTRTGLHLVASYGRSLEGEDWSRLDGEFHFFPPGAPKIGHVGASGEPVLLQSMESNDRGWPEHPGWVERERIRSFAAQPLIFQGSVLGVIAVFSRERLGPSELAWLRTFADQAAVAIVNSRAFAEIESLRRDLERENAYLREEATTTVAPAGIIGTSAALRRAVLQAELVAATNSTVLLLGESGTGKELLAREIHQRSARRDKPFVKVNCGSIPRELFESEFFGHVKGAFTGATKDRLGRFQLADRGTLFLDEVGEIPLELQPKLLRVLQEGEFERVGDEKTTRVDVRVIAATNRDLQAETKAGRFREDLYYRLSVFPIVVPPLRDRIEDVPELVAHFIELARQRFVRPQFALGENDLDALRRYSWPGNVRELANVIERAAILSPAGKNIRVDTLLARNDDLPAVGQSRSDTPARSGFVTDTEWREREKQNLLAALDRSGGKIFGPGGAAELLGMKPTTLASRLRALGIRRRPPR